jgi:PTH1 family peptidyl-tRNA hydrolase
MNKYLIVGLGNIGDEYAHTRHNIGFDVVEAFVARHGGSFQSERLAFTASVKLRGRQLICIKPTTYMNLSGKAVKYWMDKEKIEVSNILVILDELALPLEKLRLRASGSSGGHNGLKSIEASLLSTDYPRLRFGIGNQYPKGGQVDFVLSRWDEAEWPLVRKKADICCDLIETYVMQGVEAAMTHFNKLVITV